MLDEEVLLPRTTDDTFLQKLHQTHEKKHEKYVKPVKLRNSFIIKHYAGDVCAPFFLFDSFIFIEIDAGDLLCGELFGEE